MQDNASTQAQLDELLRIAKSNERKQANFQEHELDLLNSTSLHALLKTLLLNHKMRFQLTEVTLLLHDPEYEFQRLIEAEPYDESWHKKLLFTDSHHVIEQHYIPQQKPRLSSFSIHRHSFLFPGHKELGSVALLPLIRQNRIIGSLNLGSRNPTRFQRNIGTLFLEHFAAVVSSCIENARLHQHIKLVGLHDPLTGINNRRFFDQRLGEEVSRAKRAGSPLSALFIDIDFFKRINDEHGHQTGDSVLKQTSQLLNKRLRQNDVLARYGGEEFVILLADTTMEVALNIAEAIRALIEETDFDMPSGNTLNITVSVGLSTMDKMIDFKDGEALLEAADQALYVAKRSGRNQVRLANQ